MQNSNLTIEEHNEKVLRYLFETYFTRLCQFMHTYWDNQQEIEEEVMDIFIYLWKHPEKIAPNLSIKAYLFQSARNKCKTLPLEEVKHSISLHESTFLEAQELHDLIQRAIMAIPENSREIFLKSRDENLTNQEIADKMNISIKTVEKHITRSLKIVKSIIGDSYIYLIFL